MTRSSRNACLISSRGRERGRGASPAIRNCPSSTRRRLTGGLAIARLKSVGPISLSRKVTTRRAKQIGPSRLLNGGGRRSKPRSGLAWGSGRAAPTRTAVGGSAVRRDRMALVIAPVLIRPRVTVGG